MLISKTIEDIRARVITAKMAGQRVSFVPTMGALHEGHLSLVDLAKQHGEFVVMSVFVNPIQFNDSKDLGSYPRELEQDLAKANARGVSLVFTPSDSEMYSDDSPCRIIAGSRAAGLCGAMRSGHFDGVVTVVSMLFNIVQPEVAVFGAKDYQQVSVIRQLVQNFHFPVDILIAPIVREPDGLAMSSRNLLLLSEDRESALILSRTLFVAQKLVRNGEISVPVLKEFVQAEFLKCRQLKIDYIEIVDVETLEPLKEISNSAQLIVAVFCGKVRLIDNVRLQLVCHEV